jgi:DNA-binding transcriptional regulator YhcF (GntR family)
MKKWNLMIDARLEKPVYKQIRHSIEQNIELEVLLPGDQLPSIHKLALEFHLSTGTITRAYEELRELGIISSMRGKGYFISSVDVALRYRIFLLMDRISAFKEILYDSFRNEFDDSTDIQVFFHHYNIKRFEKLIRENQGKFSHYILMPHLDQDIAKIIKKLPEKKLIFIDNFPTNLSTAANAVYQDFVNDIYQALNQKIDKIMKYKAIHLSLSQSHFQYVPEGIKTGFISFCTEHGLNHSIIRNINELNLKQDELFIIFDDRELLYALKLIAVRNWKIGQNIGIISFDESPMKELLVGGISVLSTDFVQMGKTAADMVKGEIKGQIANPFTLFDRNSF